MSNEPTIDDKNTTIAKFMGILAVPAGTIAIGKIKPPYESIAFLNYHEKWELLMPVVIRIKNDESLRLRVPCNGISDSIWPYINATKYMNQRLLRADITGTHEGVYQFIQWFNQQKQTNG